MHLSIQEKSKRLKPWKIKKRAKLKKASDYKKDGHDTQASKSDPGHDIKNPQTHLNLKQLLK